jgi:hypothetical protein
VIVSYSICVVSDANSTLIHLPLPAAAAAGAIAAPQQFVVPSSNATINQVQSQLFTSLVRDNSILQRRLIENEHRRALQNAERDRSDDQTAADLLRLRSDLASLAHTVGLL